jgi:hypothetical protein
VLLLDERPDRDMRPVNVKEIQHYQLVVLQLQILPGTVGLLDRLYPEGRVYFRGVVETSKVTVLVMVCFALARNAVCIWPPSPEALAVITIG